MREYEKYWLKKGTELNGKYEIIMAQLSRQKFDVFIMN